LRGTCRGEQRDVPEEHENGDSREREKSAGEGARRPRAPAVGRGGISWSRARQSRGSLAGRRETEAGRQDRPFADLMQPHLMPRTRGRTLFESW
jgi:hypothetical protein